MAGPQYIVLDGESNNIMFHSKNVVDILAVNSPIHLPFIGRDVFRVLADCTISPPRNFKSDIKRSIDVGQAISATVRLATPRSVTGGSSREQSFVTHWTPLKDEHGAVSHIVLTLSA